MKLKLVLFISVLALITGGCASALPTPETEPNDSIATADPVVVHYFPASGSITPGGDEDYFSFQAEAGTDYEIKVEWKSGENYNVMFELYDSGGFELTSSYAVYTITYYSSSTETLYIHIYDIFVNETGDYILTIEEID